MGTAGRAHRASGRGDRARVRVLATSLVALALGAAPARADEPEPEVSDAPAASEAPEQRPPEQRPPDRELPDYDGLPEPGDDVGDVFLWSARILTGPLYLISEFVIRRPLGWLAAEIEKRRWIQDIRDFFTFGPDDQITVLPTVLYEFGFQPSVGLYASWRSLFFEENRLSTHGAIGGTDWLTWTITDRITGPGNAWQVGARFLAQRRPDHIFGGVGPDATVSRRARFGAERIEAELWSTARFWQSSRFGFDLSYRGLGFIDEGWGGEPSVGQRSTQDRTALPFGFTTGYERIGASARVDLDTRSPEREEPEGGVQVGVYGGYWGAFGGLPSFERWLRWGGSATVGTEILDRHRVLGATIEAHLITPIDGSLVPFTELIDVGGDGPLSGYRPGHIRAFGTAALTAHYTWPVWMFVDARVFLAAGNAFGEHLEDFDVSLLRLSFGLVLQPHPPEGETPFDLRIAFATETFDRGADIDSVRFAIGIRNAL